MAARRKSSSRGRRRNTGKLALKLALVAGVVGVFTSLIVGMILVSKMAGQVTGDEARAVINQSYMVAVVLAGSWPWPTSPAAPWIPGATSTVPWG